MEQLPVGPPDCRFKALFRRVNVRLKLNHFCILNQGKTGLLDSVHAVVEVVANSTWPPAAQFLLDPQERPGEENGPSNAPFAGLVLKVVTKPLPLGTGSKAGAEAASPSEKE